MTKNKPMPNIALDGMIAEEVMGWPIVQAGGEEWFDKAVEGGAKFPFFAVWPEGGSALYMDDSPSGESDLWSPSSNARHAADALMKRFSEYRISLTGPEYKGSPFPGNWIIKIHHPEDDSELALECDPAYELAVSKAMLKAVRNEKKAKKK